MQACSSIPQDNVALKHAACSIFLLTLAPQQGRSLSCFCSFRVRGSYLAWVATCSGAAISLGSYNASVATCFDIAIWLGRYNTEVATSREKLFCQADIPHFETCSRSRPCCPVLQHAHICVALCSKCSFVQLQSACSPAQDIAFSLYNSCALCVGAQMTAPNQFFSTKLRSRLHFGAPQGSAVSLGLVVNLCGARPTKCHTQIDKRILKLGQRNTAGSSWSDIVLMCGKGNIHNILL